MIYLEHHQEQVLVSNCASEKSLNDLIFLASSQQKRKEHFISDLKIAISDKNSIYERKINKLLITTLTKIVRVV